MAGRQVIGFKNMSGHSKWSKVKHKKAITDVKKGKIFSKLARLITVAAREKGGEPETNPKLRMAIEKAKQANMSSENIKRAIQRGTGKIEGVNLEEVLYEAYGPGGAAILISCITDNKNRALSEIKHILHSRGGKIAEPGSVVWGFERQNNGYVAKYPMEITNEKEKNSLKELLHALNEHDDVQEVYTNATRNL
ncbi:MAG: YebC/PmpR family DNA-binding transcriptional regulator [Promethearchaeota archaeon]